MRDLLKILRRKDFFWLQVLGVFLLLLSNISTLGVPLLISKIIDGYFATKQFNNVLLMIAIAMTVSGTVFVFFQNYIFNFLGEKLAYVFREKLIRKLVFQPEHYFVKNQPEKVLTVLTSDVAMVRQVFGNLVSTVVTVAIMLLGSSILMFSLNVSLTLLIILMVVVVVGISFVSISKVKEIFAKNRVVRDKFNRLIDENVRGAMLVRVFVSELFEKDKFKAINTDTYQLGVDMVRKMALIPTSITTVNMFASFLILMIGGRQVISGALTLGDLTIFLNYVMMFVMALLILGFISTMIGQAMVSLKRITDIISAPNEFDNGKEKIDKIESIEMIDVCYTIDGKEILNKVNIKISKKERVAFVGLVGSGKSVLLQLLMRLVEPTTGEILLNGRDIKEFDIRIVREKIGVAFQEDFLIDSSIYENIDFGRTLPNKAINEAMDNALVREFVDKFADKEKYNVGEFGRKLSGGQKQRVGIARAIAGKPQLIVLDDVTSNLDANTEKQIVKNIVDNLFGPMILVVSQKISSIKDCDRIYVMEEGKITGEGNHKSLMNDSVLYQEIALTQQNYGNN